MRKIKLNHQPWVSEFFLLVKNADQYAGRGKVWSEFADLLSVYHNVSKWGEKNHVSVT